jgi:hypothetical protein
MKNAMKEFIVIGAYIGECCPQAHSVELRVKAKSPEEAASQVTAFMEERGWAVGDTVVLESSAEMWTLEELREAYAE